MKAKRPRRSGATTTPAQAVRTREELLRDMLQLAVPMWIEKFRGSSFEERTAWAKSDGFYIAEHGDDILFKTKGRTALAFNRLARGVACAAYQPGGIKVFGLRFVAEPCIEIHDIEVCCDTCRPAHSDGQERESQ